MSKKKAARTKPSADLSAPATTPATDASVPAPAQPFEPDPPRTLAVLRVLWGVLLFGQVMLIIFAAVFIHRPSGQAIGASLAWQLFGINSFLLVFNILLGTFLRNQLYKRNWRGTVVSPMGYFIANVVMFAMIEGVVLFGVLNVILSMSFWPAILPAALALMVYAVNFPHGGPMFDNTSQPPQAF